MRPAPRPQERFTVVDESNNRQGYSEPFEMEGWTCFTFDGRQKAYNDFTWHTGITLRYDTYDAGRNRSGIFPNQGIIKAGADDKALMTRMVTMTTLCMMILISSIPK